MDTNKEYYLKAYELVIKEEFYFNEAYQTRVKFYTGAMSLLLVATIAGVIKSTLWYHFIALITGPILTFLIASIASGGTFSLYQRFLESA